MISNFRTIVFVAALSAMSVGGQLACHADDLPEGVRDTQSENDVSLTPLESLKRMRVPEGFHVSLFAGEPDIRRPIAFDFDDRGRLWVVENYSHPNWQRGEGKDRIVILEDVDHDGQFDRRKIFWDRGRYLSGIAWGHGGVWIANTPELAFIPDRDGDDVPDSEPISKLDGFQVSQHNVVNNLHWGPDGWLYGAIGLATKSFVGKPRTPRSEREMITRGMWRYHPYEERFEVLARGMVNPWGADFNELGDLFTANTVIAHLWHIVPGMYCQRRGFEKDNRYAYGRLQSIADHLHWGGGQWQSSRVTDPHHDDAGGGHAHCGAMIYLGDNWPDEYRGQFFTGNLHGNRLNNDQLVQKGSTYVGLHRPDFLFANDKWFRSMSQKYGPDGGVFVSDWHDFGECHDKDGSHRSSGRIYKVVYGTPDKRTIDLRTNSAEQLAELHMHKNEWLVRHARRLLHEKFMAGTDVSDAAPALQTQFANGETSVLRLRAMWTLTLIDKLPPEKLLKHTADTDPEIRRWAAKLLVDQAGWHDDTIETLERLALDPSARVRLVVACALQKMPADTKWSVAAKLLSHDADRQDDYLPLMIWYGIEPNVTDAPAKSLEHAASARIPLVSQFIVRRLMDEDTDFAEDIVQFIRKLPDALSQANALAGMVDSLENRGTVRPPTAWPDLNRELQASDSDQLKSLATRIAVRFGDADAIRELRMRLVDASLATSDRRSAFNTLAGIENGLSRTTLHKLLRSQPELRTQALQELVTKSDASTGELVLSIYSNLTATQKQAAVAALVSRADTAKQLLDAMRGGGVAHADVSLYELQRLKQFKSPSVKSAVAKIWPVGSAKVAKASEMSRYKSLLTDDYLASGNPSRGRRIFEATCAKCHRLFGEGNDLAPDLTGSGRANLDYILSNLIDPSGIIDPAYRLTTALTEEGRVINGFIVEQGERSVRLRTQQGEIDLPLTEVQSLETSSQSMMPEGLLRTYKDEEVRDLILYLASPEQVPLSGSKL